MSATPLSTVYCLYGWLQAAIGTSGSSNRWLQPHSHHTTWAPAWLASYTMVHADASSGQPINSRQTFAKATDGPPGITVLGRSMWTFLHSMAAAYPDQPTAPERDSMQQFLESFTKVHPSLYCRGWFAQKMTDKPPPLDSRKELAQWLCHLHNDINEALGKQLFNCDQVDQRWGDEAM